MIHARTDYDRIQDPAINDASLLSEGSFPIKQDEPVFLLRAKDKHFITMLGQYMALIAEDVEGDLIQIKAITEHIKLAMDWQSRNRGVKTPDMPKETLR